MTHPLFAPGGLLEMEAAHTIHARAVDGRHSRWRWAFVWLTQAVFYGLPWCRVAGQPALWFDLEGRRFFVFGAVLFPQDLFWLTALLVASALLLFFATAVIGRVWCGFACPQTVYSALYAWIEYRCEGDSRARQALDAQPWGARKLLRRGGKHAVWLLLSAWTGLSLVGYFTPIRELLAATPGAWGPWALFWTGAYGLAAYGHAGFLREKVCQHMCPYGRFQGSLMDAHTLNVSYDTRRGEPRGHRARSDDAAALGLGACVDCTLCVQVCPMGIDIRHGLQPSCINCGVCIDACDQVMDRIGQPRGLLRFASQQELSQPLPPQAPPPLWRRLPAALARPRAALYGLLLALSCAGLAWGLATRPTLRVDAMRDRAVLAREVEEGAIENIYQLLLINAQAAEVPVRLRVLRQADGQVPEGLAVLGPTALRLPGAQTTLVRLTLRVPAATVGRWPGPVEPIRFVLESTDPARPALAGTASTFLRPR